MTFFYDLNKKLDGIRATPEVKTQQLNEQVSPLTQILNERSTGAVHTKIAEAAAGYSPSMQAKIKIATPQQLGKMANDLAGSPSHYAHELKMLQQAKAALLGQMEEGIMDVVKAVGNAAPKPRGLATTGVAGMTGSSAFGKKNAADLAFAEQIPDQAAKAQFLKDVDNIKASRSQSFQGMSGAALNAFEENKFKKIKQQLAAQYNIPLDVQEAYNPNSVGAENRRGLDASHAANLKKKAAAGDAKAQAALQHLKDKKERRGNDFNARMERESVGMAEGGKPDFLDIDKDGNRTEPMKSAARSAKGMKEGDLFTNIYKVMFVDPEGVAKVIGKVSNPGEAKKIVQVSFDNHFDTGDRLRKVAPNIFVLETDYTNTGTRATLDNYKDFYHWIVKASDRGMKEGGIPMTPKQKSFAKLAPPVDKITFADKIVGAKKEVDEVLGDVAAQAMRKAVGRHDQDMEEASTGNAFDWKNRKEPEVQKPASFVHKGTYGTEYDGDKEDAKAIRTKKQAAAAAGQGSRGRGRPKNNASADTGEVMKPDFSAFGDKVKLKPHAGKITRNKMVGEDDLDPKDQGEYDQEGDMAKDSIKTVVRHAQALEKILGDDDNLPEWVQSKLAKIEGMMTAVDDYMQNQADDMDGDEEQPIAEKAVSKKQQRFMGMVSAAKKGEKPASKEVAKVAKTMKKGDVEDFASTKHKGLPEKAAKKTKEVDETTTSGSMATSGGAPKSSGGMSYGKGIYDSLNRELEGMISESMSINMSMNNDDNGPSRNLTVTATDEDATALASMLRMAGMVGGNDHMPHMNNGVVQPEEIKVIDFDDGTDDLAAELSDELHGGHDSDHSETCPTCGSSDCGCNSEESMDEAYGDTDETLNKPDWPTDAEGTEDAMMYSGGLNKPKSTGQSTVPVLASQQDRQHAYEDAAALRRMMEMAGVDSKDKYEKLNEIGLNLMQPRTSWAAASSPGAAEYNDKANANAMSAKYDAYIEKYEQELEQLKASPTATMPGTVRAISSLEQSIKGLRAERLHNVMAAIPDDATNALRKQAIANNELTPGQWLQKATQYFKGKITGQPQPGVEYDRTDSSKQLKPGWTTPTPYVPPAAPVSVKESNDDTEFNESIQRMREIAGLPVAEAAPPVKLATPQDVPEPVSPASAAAAPGKKPVVKPVTKSATPQAVDEPVKPVKEDKMAQSLMRELHNFKY